MKKIIALLLALVLVLGLAACGASEPAAPEAPKAEEPKVETPVVETPAETKKYEGVELTYWSMWSSGEPQALELPHAPKQFLHYFEEENRPQTRLDRDIEGGMAVSIGRLRPDTQYDYKFVCLSHNTLRGAAGGAMLMAELYAAKGYFD